MSVNGNNLDNVYVHGVDDHLFVYVGVLGVQPLNRKVLLKPQGLVKPALRFINDLVAQLPEDAVVIPHHSAPEKKFAGSERFGYVLTVNPQYQSKLLEAIHEINVE